MAGATKQQVIREDAGDAENLNEEKLLDSQNDVQEGSLATELKLFLSIATLSSGIELFVLLISTFVASYVGVHLGTTELASYSLASLTGNLMCLSVIIGSLTAYETLGPRAYNSRRYEEVGRLAVRAFSVTSFLLIPSTIVVLFFLEPILVALGQDRTVASLASKWIRVYIIGVPSVLLFRTLQRYLAAQNLVASVTYGAFAGTFVTGPLLIGFFVDEFGFVGSAAALVSVQTLTFFFSLFHVRYWKPHNTQTWPGVYSLWKDSFEVEAVVEFLQLSTGGVTSCMEWWFWEAIAFVAGKLGVLPLAVHSVAYQLVPLAFMLPLGISIGMTVRIGALLSKKNVSGAKRLVRLGTIFVACLAALVALIIYCFRDGIIRLFTNDEKVVQGCKTIWPYLCVFIFLDYGYCINYGILKALGKQWLCCGIIMLNLWIIAFPTTLYVAVIKNGGLSVIWKIVPAFYVLLNICLVTSYTIFIDWNDVANQILLRNTNVTNKVNERSVLLKK